MDVAGTAGREAAAQAENLVDAGAFQRVFQRLASSRFERLLATISAGHSDAWHEPGSTPAEPPGKHAGLGPSRGESRDDRP
jgi:hypothetical protein